MSSNFLYVSVKLNLASSIVSVAFAPSVVTFLCKQFTLLVFPSLVFITIGMIAYTKHLLDDGFSIFSFTLVCVAFQLVPLRPVVSDHWSEHH